MNIYIRTLHLPLLEAHDSLCLLWSTFVIPKLLYILRTAPCFLSPSLDRFDGLQRSQIESICNIQRSDASWLQPSLPINNRGLGIRSPAMLAPSAYLASAAGSAPISQAILPSSVTPSLPSIQAQALVKWEKWVDQSVNLPPPAQVWPPPNRRPGTHLLLRVASLACLTSKQLTAGKELGCRPAVKKNQTSGTYDWSLFIPIHFYTFLHILFWLHSSI